MSKKRTIRRRGLSAVLALSVCFGLLPPTAGAAVTAEHDLQTQHIPSGSSDGTEA